MNDVERVSGQRRVQGGLIVRDGSGRLPPHGHRRFPHILTDGPAEGRGQFASALGTLIGELGQRPLNDRLDLRSQVLGADLGKCGNRLAQVGGQECIDVVGCERQPAGEEFVDNDPHRVEIAAMIDGVAADHFRTHVSRSAHRMDIASSRQFRDVEVRLGGEAGEAEVHDLDGFVGRAGRANHEVRWLEIPVDDPRGVCGLENVTEVADELARSFGREHPVANEQGLERDSRYVLEDEAWADGVIDRGLEELHRVGMAELPHRLDFGRKELSELGMRNDVAVDALHDHRRTVAQRFREENLGIAPLAEQPGKPVLTQRGLSEHPILPVRRAARPGDLTKLGFFLGGGKL